MKTKLPLGVFAMLDILSFYVQAMMWGWFGFVGIVILRRV